MAANDSLRRYQEWYTRLLLLYPEPFYQRFGEGMRQTFGDLLRERVKDQRGLFGWTFWVFTETMIGIVKENILFTRMQAKPVLRVALVTGGLLLIPLLAQWPWTLSDFVIMGMLIFGAGLAYEFVTSRGHTVAYRAAAGMAVLTTFLLTWVNLAVGIIGDDNPANLMYFAVPLVGLIGAVMTRLDARGMMRTLFAMALTQVLIPLIALILWSPSTISWSPGVFHVFGLNMFFAMLFAGSAFLFRYSSALNTKLNRSP